jgi:spermidine synthase
MSRRIEELSWQETPMGVVSLRRRWDPVSGSEVYEAKLDDEFLMSSLFTVAEVELARLALAAMDGPELDVVVGGLGLGYTACAVLADRRVRSLLVVEALDEVIGWHRRGLLPDARSLCADPRCRLVHADFFAATAGPVGYDPERPERRFDAVLVDIDHSPSHLLHPGHAAFYTAGGLRRLAGRLRPGGVFGLWSNDPPDDCVTARLAAAFGTARAHVVAFDNPLQGRPAANTVYLAAVGRAAGMPRG